MSISDHAADFYFHIGVVVPDRHLQVKDLKKLSPRMDEAGLDYTRSAFAPNDAVFENVDAETPEKTVYRVTQKFIAATHHNVQGLQFEAFCKLAETFFPLALEIVQAPTLVIQECFVRKLAPSPEGEDSRNFLAQRVLRIDSERIGRFERPLHGLGIRLHFPADQQHPVENDVKVESFLRDPTRLFLENHARFLKPLPPDKPKLVIECLRKTRAFLEEKVFGFLESS